MVNFALLFLRAYDRVSEMCGTVKRLIDYYTSSTPSKWVFLNSSTTPIPIGTFHNSRYDLPSNIEYIFDTYNQTLLLSRGAHRTETLPFLSGTLSVANRSFSLDEFIDKAQFEMTSTKIPIPLMILRCWSIVNGVWFCEEHNPVFDFIDMEGNEHSFEIFSIDLDYALWDRLLLQNDVSDDETDTETEIESDPESESESESTDISGASVVSTESTGDATPVAQVEPVEPVAQVEPVAPVVPVAQVEPVAPVVPVEATPLPASDAEEDDTEPAPLPLLTEVPVQHSY